jgi:hypothetical protein
MSASCLADSRAGASGRIVDALRPVGYEWDGDERTKKDGRKHLGFLATDVVEALPRAELDGGNGLKSFDDKAVLAVLVEEVQALRRRVKALESKR